MVSRTQRPAGAIRLDTPVKFLKGIGERRAEQLEDDEVRHRQQAQRAVTRVQGEPPVAPERLRQPALPAPPLA